MRQGDAWVRGWFITADGHNKNSAADTPVVMKIKTYSVSNKTQQTLLLFIPSPQLLD